MKTKGDEKIISLVGVAGFEPATSSSQTRRDDRATLHPVAVCERKDNCFLFLCNAILLFFANSCKLLRRDGDSNPGYPVRVRLFSKQVLSATQAPLQNFKFIFNERGCKYIKFNLCTPILIKNFLTFF